LNQVVLSSSDVNGNFSELYSGFPVADWCDVAAVIDRNAGEMRLFMNGIQINSCTISGDDNFSNSAPLLIGSSAEGSGWLPFMGAIDHVAIWNAVRSPQEILSDFEGGLTGTETGLAAYWRFGEAGGDHAIDESSNANHGLLGGGSETSKPTRIRFSHFLITLTSMFCSRLTPRWSTR